MRVLTTMPGRLGDIFWALATVRTISEQVEAPVDFACSPKYAAVLPIVQAQPYIREAFAIPGWDVQETAPMTPWEAPATFGWDQAGASHYDHVLHLGYRRWPHLPLAFEIAEQHDVPLTQQDLERPWITSPPAVTSPRLAVGFTDEYFELKYGILQLATKYTPMSTDVLCAEGSRWNTEAGVVHSSLRLAGHMIAGCEVFLGCLSALAVLAAAMGKPRVLVEPNPQRHHPIFQHWDTPLVTGNDGLPTFDARHVADALRAKLGGSR